MFGIATRTPERHVDVLAPFEQRPVRVDGVEVLHGRRGLRRDDLLAVAEGEALDPAALLEPAAPIHRTDQFHEDLLALAAHDGVDPGRLGQDLLVHEGRMHAAEHPKRLGHRVPRDLEHTLGGIDRGRDRGDADHVRLQVDHPRLQVLVAQMVGHRVDEGHLCIARRLQRSRQIGDPGRGPVPRDLGAARMVVWVNEQDMHGVASQGKGRSRRLRPSVSEKFDIDQVRKI
jgi:hypothetical protein